MNEIPIITIDGTSGTGKGTISQLLARALGWHYLDSGALYRSLAYAASQASIAAEDENALLILAANLPIVFMVDVQGLETRASYQGEDITVAIRSEACGEMASKISQLPLVRQALLERQQHFAQLPGLVTDGRDMGSVVFPDAQLKLFLTASLAERSHRRFLQLQQKGLNVNLAQIQRELDKRDQRDASRSVAPLKPAKDAIQLDTTNMTVEQTFQRVYELVSQRFVRDKE